ncbi:hypothetical protein [Natronorubrum daqingense]|uniref:Uncharacterized protein n=1 Tax=Natronorubrum daqingense TaxID=588898 RepID=A0A1N7E9X3_9EURY|nr:hypothetical protein [Natronorubrum daqingense]APX96438.1 hypothetical protein BB347_07305 [Natronorubrum daqingense]SIR84755.1 hypothetical protein SAMN05421809_2551 [Natronorubrum daqingense]
MTPDPTRRRVLQLTGAGATASLAGCSSLVGDNDEELEADEEPDIEPSEGVTALTHPPEEEMMELQEEVMADVEAGEIDEAEVEQEMMSRQQEVVMSTAVEFESAHADDDDITIEAGVGEEGAFLLTGSEERFIELLQEGEIDGLLAGEEYEIALGADDGQPEPEPEPEPEPDEDEVEDDDDSDETDEDESESDDDSDDEDADDSSDDGDSDAGDDGDSDAGDDEA